jgi:hypothetical protein
MRVSGSLTSAATAAQPPDLLRLARWITARMNADWLTGTVFVPVK